MICGKAKIKKAPRIKANPDVRKPLSAWLKLNLAAAYSWISRGAYPVASCKSQHQGTQQIIKVSYHSEEDARAQEQDSVMLLDGSVL